MAFLRKRKKKSESSSSRWLKIIPDVPVVFQIMDEHPELIFKHWLADGSGRRVGVRCPGKDVCPICQQNASINWDRDHPEYIGTNRRYRINVLELTPVKRCPGCEAVYPARSASNTCSTDGCHEDLSDVKSGPLNEVKILERGPRLMEQFNAYDGLEHPMVGEVLPLQAYPFMLIAKIPDGGRRIDMTINIIPQMPSDIDLSNYEKYDLLDDLVLAYEELEHLMNGGVYSDILSARSADSSEDDEEEEEKEIPF